MRVGTPDAIRDWLASEKRVAAIWRLFREVSRTADQAFKARLILPKTETVRSTFSDLSVEPGADRIVSMFVNPRAPVDYAFAGNTSQQADDTGLAFAILADLMEFAVLVAEIVSVDGPPTPGAGEYQPLVSNVASEAIRLLRFVPVSGPLRLAVENRLFPRFDHGSNVSSWFGTSAPDGMTRHTLATTEDRGFVPYSYEPREVDIFQSFDPILVAYPANRQPPGAGGHHLMYLPALSREWPGRTIFRDWTEKRWG